MSTILYLSVGFALIALFVGYRIMVYDPKVTLVLSCVTFGVVYSCALWAKKWVLTHLRQSEVNEHESTLKHNTIMDKFEIDQLKELASSRIQNPARFSFVNCDLKGEVPLHANFAPYVKEFLQTFYRLESLDVQLVIGAAFVELWHGNDQVIKIGEGLECDVCVCAESEFVYLITWGDEFNGETESYSSIFHLLIEISGGVIPDAKCLSLYEENCPESKSSAL